MKTLRNLGLAGILTAGSLGLAGCMMTPGDVERFVNTGSFISQEKQGTQWIKIDGKMGYINHQGYGIVPVSDDRYGVYQFTNEEWNNISGNVRVVKASNQGGKIYVYPKK